MSDKTVVVLPTYNESETLRSDLLVVDDSSRTAPMSGGIVLEAVRRVTARGLRRLLAHRRPRRQEEHARV